MLSDPGSMAFVYKDMRARFNITIRQHHYVVGEPPSSCSPFPHNHAGRGSPPIIELGLDTLLRNLRYIRSPTGHRETNTPRSAQATLYAWKLPKTGPRKVTQPK